MRPLSEIVVHCAATRPEWMADAQLEDQIAEIRHWHMSKDPPWRDIGYHYIVGRGGRVLPGRPLEQTGAHVKGRNAGTIGVCLIGGHGSASTDRFEEHFTPAQDRTLRDLINNLLVRYPSITKISGHNQYAAKACPGFHVPTWWSAGKEVATEAALPSFLKGLCSRIKGG